MSNPVYFPPLNSAGVLVHRPYGQRPAFSTQVQDSPSGKRYTFAEYGAGLTNFPAGPLSKFDLEYAAMPDADAATLQAFFDSMEGRLGEFSYLDPGGNLVSWSEDFTNVAWTLQTLSVSTGVTDPWGGTRAQTLTGTGSNSLAYTTVIPGGFASGFVLCGSIYARAASPGQSLCIGFVDSGFSVLASQTWSLPQNQWKRIWIAKTLATSSYIRFLIGGLSTWATTAISLFGAQCAPLPGPGAYRKTPGSEGLHAQCRFDTDDFALRIVGPNENRVTLPISEYF